MSDSEVDNILNRLTIGEKKKISKSNIEDIKRFDNYNKALGRKLTTRRKQARNIIQFARTIRKDFRKISKDDIQNHIGTLQIAGSTLTQRKIILKKFFRWLYETEDYPLPVRWLKINRDSYNYKKPSEMLDDEEVSKLINGCVRLRDRAIISLLYDSAIRIGELTGLNIGDVKSEGEIITITVDGKTGQINVELISSVPLLTRWIDEHPFKNDITKSLWLSYTPTNYLQRLTNSGVSEVIRQARRNSGIKKRVTAHIFRHSKLTQLARKGFTEEMLRKFAGWAPGSNMPMVYIHLNQKDVAIKRRELETGETPKEKENKRSLLLPIICPRCNYKNDVNDNYCKKCWLPLNQQSANKDLKILHTFRSNFVRKILHLDVDKYIDDYYSFKELITEMVNFYRAFNGSKRSSVNEIKKILGWKLDKFELFIEQLRQANLIEISNGEIQILGGDKTVFDNFLLFEKLYVTPPED